MSGTRYADVKAPDAGFTILEVLVSLLLLTMVAFAVLRCLIMSSEMAHTSSLCSSAIYRSQEKIEEVLSDSYGNITEENYPSEAGLLLDGRGTTSPEDDIFLNRTIAINEIVTPAYQLKDVTVTSRFTFAGTDYSQSINALVAKAGR